MNEPEKVPEPMFITANAGRVENFGEGVPLVLLSALLEQRLADYAGAVRLDEAAFPGSWAHNPLHATAALDALRSQIEAERQAAVEQAKRTPVRSLVIGAQPREADGNILIAPELLQAVVDRAEAAEARLRELEALRGAGKDA